MPSYQFRLRAGIDMRLATQIWECSDDYDAMTVAERLLKGGGLAHVWAGERNVGQVFLPVAKSGESVVPRTPPRKTLQASAPVSGV